jgi:hypothetical protein
LNLYKTKREKYDVLKAELAALRSPFEGPWQEVADYALPNRLSLTLGDRKTKANKRSSKIVDATATRSIRTLSAAMMSGFTNPAREWGQYTTLDDKDLAEFGPVKEWLHRVTHRVLTFFQRSNLYQVLPSNYEDTIAFAIGGFLVEEDFNTLIHCQPLLVGRYWIAKDRKGTVNTLIREFQYTTRQLVEEFGKLNQKSGSADWSNISQQVKTAWDNGNYNVLWDIRHVIMPNDDYMPRAVDAKYKRFSSCYYEMGTASNGQYASGTQPDVFLSESGYDYFPGIFPRWKVAGEDVYGSDSPTLLSLGEIKALQLAHKNYDTIIALKAKPPMVGHPDLKGTSAGVVPGHITWADEADGQRRFRSAIEGVDLDPRGLLEKIQDCRGSIKESHYEDLVKMITMLEQQKGQKTATEIIEGKEEKLMVMGPVVHQFDQDQNDRLFDLAFQFLVNQKDPVIKEAPDELRGEQLRTTYSSIMHQALKAMGLSSLERTSQFVISLAELFPEVKHKYNAMQAVDEFGTMAGVAPKVIRSDEEAEAMLAQEQQAMQAARTAEIAATTAGAARDLASADTSGTNALTELMERGRAGEIVPTGGEAA